MRSWSLLLAAVVLALGASGSWKEASAQDVQINRIGGAIELGADLSRQTTENPLGERVFERNRFEEKISLEFHGHAVTSDFLRFRLGGTFGLRQEFLDSTDAVLGEAPSTIWGYDVVLDLLPSKPVSLLFFSNRREESRVQDFGTDTDVLSENLGATLRLAIPHFPSLLTWKRSHSVVESRGSGFFSRRDETRDLLEFTGQHFSEQTLATLRLRTEDVEDDSIPPVADFNIREGNGSFSHRWGPYLEKSIRSNLRYFDRDGEFTFTSATASNTLRWDVTETLATQFEHQFTRFTNDDQLTMTNRLAASLFHRAYDSLWTTLRLLAERTDLDNGERTAFGPELTLRYRKNLLWSSRLLLDFQGRYVIDERNLEDARVTATGETLAIRGPVDNFLANRRVDTSSVSVFNAQGSQFILGLDYVVDQVGDRTSINPLIGGAISVGDVVLVNYAFLTDPQVTLGRSFLRFGVGWELDWLLVRYDHNRTDETLLDGQVDTLQDTRRHSFSVDLRHDGRRLRANAGVILVRDQTANVEYDEVAFHQFLSWRLMPGLEWMIQLRQAMREFVVPVRDTQLLSASSSLNWRSRRGHSARLFFRFRDIQDTTALDQTDIEIGVRGKFRFGKIEIHPTVRWSQRERGETTSTDLRGVLRLTRRF